MVGYDLHHAGESETMAIRRAFDLVILTRMEGLDIRAWAEKASKDTKEWVQWANQLRRDYFSRALNFEEVERKVSQLTTYESSLLHHIRGYLANLNQHMEELKKLNPPLNSQQLEPFEVAIRHERQTTVRSLDILTGLLENLMRTKLEIYKNLPEAAL